MGDAPGRPRSAAGTDGGERLAAGELQAAFSRARRRAGSVPRAVRAHLVGSEDAERAPIPTTVHLVDWRKQMVAHGYDALGDRFAAWGARVVGDPAGGYLDRFCELVPEGGAVLDLGCGSGVPSTAQLAWSYAVTGVDISPRQIDAARRNVPGATFLAADMETLELPPAAFDGAVALYSISHVPREGHAALLRRIAGWLRPGGVLLASLGAGSADGPEDDWLGQPMFFSSFDAETNVRLVEQAGLRVIEAEPVTMREPEGEATFLWVLARR